MPDPLPVMQFRTSPQSFARIDWLDAGVYRMEAGFYVVRLGLGHSRSAA